MPTPSPFGPPTHVYQVGSDSLSSQEDLPIGLRIFHSAFIFSFLSPFVFPQGPSLQSDTFPTYALSRTLTAPGRIVPPHPILSPPPFRLLRKFEVQSHPEFTVHSLGTLPNLSLSGTSLDGGWLRSYSVDREGRVDRLQRWVGFRQPIGKMSQSLHT